MTAKGLARTDLQRAVAILEEGRRHAAKFPPEFQSAIARLRVDLAPAAARARGELLR